MRKGISTMSANANKKPSAIVTAALSRIGLGIAPALLKRRYGGVRAMSCKLTYAAPSANADRYPSSSHQGEVRSHSSPPTSDALRLHQNQRLASTCNRYRETLKERH